MHCVVGCAPVSYKSSWTLESVYWILSVCSGTRIVCDVDDITLTVQQMAPTNCMSSLKRKQAAIPGVSRSISTAPPTSPPPIRSISLPLLQSTASRGGRETAVFGVCNSDILQSDAEKPAGESPSRRTLHTALLLFCLTHCSLGDV